MNFHRRAHPVGDDGEAGRIGDRVAGGIGRLRQAHHPVAQFFARKDHGALLGKERIARGVVAMNVGVDEIADRPRADAPDRCQDLVAELGVLRIDHEDAVRSREHADPAAGRILVGRIETARARSSM